ncbi:ubiquitin carboxyl-terminal hydrolase 4-like [Babylonia areolata]|uniref:ubiquitin carboxyl-terminal hydrolase 4-like n=1 Tax=Babylonia areolata TaxID=304850 RepID=UPI003FD13F15
MAEGGPPRLDSQKSEIGNLLKSPLKKGDAWYLLDLRWFKQWKKYVGYDTWDTVNAGEETYNPGPIDNSPLFRETSGDDQEQSAHGVQRLKEHMVDELDYVLVPAEAWNKLVAWYGIVPEQEPIERHVIEQGMFVKHCKVEVYLMDLKLCDNSDISTVITKQFSRASTIEQLEQEMRNVFHIDEKKEVRLWNRYMSNTYEHLSKKDNTLQDAGLYQGQVIVVEKKNEDGTWPRQAKGTGTYSTESSYSTRSGGTGIMGSSTSSSSSSSSSYNNYDSGYGSTSSSGGSYYNSSYYDRGGGGSKPGLCGLSNLGNTCFMNSALQCMSNVPGLTSYMLSGQWEKELNKENPLGMRGEIAISFAELIREMWSGMRNYTVPRNFKVAVGRFAPQFSGYQQQDSQELMAFLLDGLHEDLNRIRKKPYIELKDASGREDALVAREAWENYKKRNDSIIVDTFHGLLKSTVECPDCHKISVTFDPFCYLSLPMPVKKERQLEVFWVMASPTAKPVQYKVTVPKGGCVRDLCTSLSHYVNTPPERMVVTDVYNHRFHKVFSFDEGLNHILDRDDIFIYEVPVRQPEEEEPFLVPIYFRHLKRRQPSSYIASTQLFGQPLVVPVPRGCTYDALYNLILARMARYVQAPQPGEAWWKTEKKEAEEDKAPEEGTSSSTTTTSTTTGQQSSSTRTSAQHSGEVGEGQSTSDLKMETESAGGDGEGKNEGEPSTSTSPTSTSTSASTSASASTSSKTMETNGPQPEETGTAAKKEGTQQQESGGGKGEKGRRIFTLSYVNSYGSSDNMPELQDNGKPLALNAHTYVSVDWNPVAKTKFYDEKAAEDMEQHQTVRQRNAQKATVLQLEDCLRLFTEAEQLSEQDPWYCPQCQKHQQATKKFDLWSLPSYLIIHLKRFSYNRYWRDKIDALVEFPTRGLDLRKYILNSENHDINMYDLIAVTNHYGGLGGGHYTAYAQNCDSGEWYYFDDSSVSSASEEAVVTKAAYVLVYKRRGVDSPSRVMPKRVRQTPESNSQAASSTQGSEVNGYGHSEDEMDVN